MSRNRLLVLVSILMLAVFAVGGCGTQVNTGMAEEPKVIQTYGEAEVKSEPDLVRISLGIETRSDSAEQAVEENARLANAVFEALKGFGLTEDEVKTGYYQLYSYREWFDERPTGEEAITYQAINEVIVSTNRIEEVGDMIDIAVRAGANNINFINFELENPQALQLRALQAATEQAEMKAGAIAESTGERISGLYRIREERTDYMPFIARQEMADDTGMGSTTPIAPDDVTVKAMVVAEFAF